MKKLVWLLLLLTLCGCGRTGAAVTETATTEAPATAPATPSTARPPAAGAAEELDRRARTLIEVWFEMPERLTVHLLGDIAVEDLPCRGIAVSETVAGEERLLGAFALDTRNWADWEQDWYFKNDAGEWEYFQCRPSFACADSPDGRWRMESVGMYLDGPSGLHALKEMQLVSLETGETVWRGESLLDNHFVWSPDSRYVAADFAGRTWRDAVVVDTQTLEAAGLPGLAEVAAALPENGQPKEDGRADPGLRPYAWGVDGELYVGFSWHNARDERVSGSYIYHTADGSWQLQQFEAQPEG